MTHQKEINREQRRCDIAKDLYPLVYKGVNPLEPMDAAAKTAVELANLLIEELKKEPTK